MILSPRNPPRLSLRRAASYNKDPGPRSSTSARFDFRHLVVSPPPSPGLPALIPRHGKALPTNTPRRWARRFFWLFSVGAILFYVVSLSWSAPGLGSASWVAHDRRQYELVGESALPDFATPLMVTDAKGRARWTISIPSHQQSPLEPQQYTDICLQSMEIAKHVASLHGPFSRSYSARKGFHATDPSFIDVADARDQGLLPAAKPSSRRSIEGRSIHNDPLNKLEACETSMTFVLEASDAGLGETLMLLWTSYGLAQKQGREFFIDDTRWAYGEFAKLFKPLAAPSCRPPPVSEMLPFPRHASHLVVSASTAPYVLGQDFTDAFEDAYKTDVRRQRRLFDLARAGYEALFQLTDADASYVDQRVTAFRERTRVAPPAEISGMVVGLHIRHGDCHPSEFQYRESYVPLTRYQEEAWSLLRKNFDDPEGQSELITNHSLVVVASDDPEVYDSEELYGAVRAQELINLASINHLDGSDKESPRSPPPTTFGAEHVGWEGGFFKGMFWSLGRRTDTQTSAHHEARAAGDVQYQLPTATALRLRELVGRAYLVDLAVLGGSSDRIVCTVSSSGCRVLAVMMGWEAAFVQGGWINIDGLFSWRGIS